MSNTGREFVTAALRELQVVPPTGDPTAAQLADGLVIGSDLLDSWAAEKLTIRGVLIATYNLVSAQQTYTIGNAGNFDQSYPTEVVRWGVISDDDAATPSERPMGRPLNDKEWAAIRVKTQTGSAPTALYFDRSYAAGVGNILVWPIPDNNDVDVRLYTRVPQILALAADTTYDLPRGYARAIKLGLALELATRFGAAATVGKDLLKRATDAKAVIQAANIVYHDGAMRREYATLGHRGAAVNVWDTDH